MNREKPRRRYRVIRTDEVPGEKHKNIIALLARLAIIPTIIGLRGAKMNPLNIVLVGFWVTWLLFDAILTVEWENLSARRITQSTPVRVVLVLAIGIITAWFTIGNYCHPPASANKEVIDAITDTGTRQADTLSKFGTELMKKMDDIVAKQTPGKRDEWRKHLMEAYPLGWRIYAADGKETYAPPGLSYEKDFIVVWDVNGVSGLTPERISMRPPNILTRGKENWGMVQMTVIRPRAVGKEFVLAVMENVAVGAKILQDEKDFVMLAVGFRQATKYDRPAVELKKH
jgi:hypothetical protein